LTDSEQFQLALPESDFVLSPIGAHAARTRKEGASREQNANEIAEARRQNPTRRQGDVFPPDAFVFCSRLLGNRI
jgi:hypothetical protein